MTPIQRISEKSQALDVLSLGKNATTADIRAAFKFLVHEKHPDHGSAAHPMSSPGSTRRISS